MTEAGHSLAHLPQPTHLPSSTCARIPGPPRWPGEDTPSHSSRRPRRPSHPPRPPAVFFPRSFKRLPNRDGSMIAPRGQNFRDLVTERPGGQTRSGPPPTEEAGPLFWEAQRGSARAALPSVPVFLSALHRSCPGGDAADIFHIDVPHAPQHMDRLAASGSAVTVDEQRGLLFSVR